MEKLYTAVSSSYSIVWKNFKSLVLTTFFAILCFSLGAQTVSLTTLGSAYTQNFDALSNTAASTTNNLTITGWFLTETGGGARDNEQYAVDNGGSTTGDTYSYGAAGSTDRALGGLQSGTLIPVIGAGFTNNTGTTITSLVISYTGEQWRIANTAAARDDRMDFQYSTNATSLTTGTWTDVNQLDFTNPIKTAVSAGALDGNAVANKSAISHTITGLSIPNGATFWIRWNDLNASGADDGLAIDDFSLTPQGAVPTNTIIVSNLNPSFTDNNVTFTATVTSNGNPVTTGTVDFKEGAITLASNVPLNGSGQAMFSTSALTEGSHNIMAVYNGTVSFLTSNGSVTQVVNNMTVVNGNSFCNEGSITLNDGGSNATGGIIGTPGTPYPSNIFVTGLSGTISSITVDVKGLNHNRASDIDLLLVAPTGEKFLMMSGVGLGTFSNTNLTLSDAAGSALPRPGAIPSGTYKPASYEANNTFPAPAPASPYNPAAPQGASTFASVFNGLNPNGTWQLYAADDTTDISGSINDGWCLNFSLSIPMLAISPDDAVKAEGNIGTTPFTFTVTRSGDVSGATSVDYAVTGSGMNPADANDFGGTLPSGVVNFLANETSKIIIINVSGDTDVEPEEGFTVTLSNPSGGATISTATATGTIQNDDILSTSIGVAKNAMVSGSQVTFNFYLENLGNEALNSLSLPDNLDAVFGAGNYSITTGPTFIDDPGTITLNASFNGSSQTSIISSGTLAVGETAQIQVVVDITNITDQGNGLGVYSNQVIAAAQGSGGGMTSDLSDNGTDSDPNGNGDPTDAGEDDPTTFYILPPPNFSKSFDGPAAAGGTAVLTFTIENLSTTNALTGITFTDDLGAVLSGLVATGLPLSDVCGVGSQISGTSLLTLTGGNLAPNASCTFDVTVQVPAATAPGTYVNTTSNLTASVSGLPAVADPATAPLSVEPPPTFAKSFSPNTIEVGQTSTLTFTIDNSASTLIASGLAFTDNLPAGMVIANPSSNASTTCTGGTLTAIAGSGTITYTGGSVAAGASCTVQVDVEGSSEGSHVNTTGDLTSSSGNSGTATATLTVNPRPTGSIHVIKYNDQDQDGTNNEVSNNNVTGNTLTDWQFTLYDSNGNFLAQGSTFVEDATNDLGVRISFSNLDPTGTYTICETSQGNWANSDPGANGSNDPENLGRACKTISANSIPPGSFINVFFGNVRFGSIMVTKYEDLNTNGQRDNGEPGLEGWQIQLRDANDNVIATTTTTMDGTAGFSDVAPGNYKICEVIQSGWGNSDPGDGTLCKSVDNFELGENREVVLGNVQCNLTVEAGENQELCLTKSATLTGAGFGGLATQATWSILSEPEAGAGTLSNTNATTTPETVTFKAAKPGTYVLQLMTDSPFGCDAAVDTVTITVLNVDCGKFPWNGGNKE